jgi:hypothetical protein
MTGAEAAEAAGVDKTAIIQHTRRGRASGAQGLLRWTIAAVLASWALNLITFWVAWGQHRDAKELLQVQISVELEKEFNSPEMRRARQRVATQALEKSELKEDRVLDFFDKVGMYVHQGRLDDDTAYESFAYWVERYWPVYQEFVRNFRSDEHDDTLYLSFEELYQLMLKEDAEDRGEPVARIRPAPHNIELFLRDEKEINP